MLPPFANTSAVVSFAKAAGGSTSLATLFVDGLRYGA